MNNTLYYQICKALSEYEQKFDCTGVFYINYYKPESIVRLERHAATHPDWDCVYEIEEENLCGENFFAVADKIFSKIEWEKK